MKTIVRVLSLIFTGIFLLLGFLLLLLGIGQYEALQGFLNQFAPDGTLASFTPALHAQIRIPLLFFGGILFVVGGTSATFRNRYKEMMEETFRWIPAFLRAVWEDACDFLKYLFPEKIPWWEWLLLLSILALAFAGQGDIIGQPEFNIIPSLVGIALCLSTYFFIRREMGTWPALATTLLMAVFPWLKLQSANEQTCIVMTLLTFWMTALGMSVRRTRNRFTWLLLVIITALNFWTMPAAFLPFVILILWLIASALVGDIADAYDGLGNFFRYLLGWITSSIILALSFSVSAFLKGGGWHPLFQPAPTGPFQWQEFSQNLLTLWNSWTTDLPVALTIFLVIGGLLSILFRRQLVKYRVSLSLSTLLTLLASFIFYKVTPSTVTWTYLLPFLLIGGVAGWFALLNRLQTRPRLDKTTTILGILLLLSFALFGVSHFWQNL